MLLMAEMIFHLTFEHGLKNGAKNLLQDVLYVFRALDVVVVEDLLSNLLAWGSWWSFTLCHSVTVLIFVYPSMGHKVDSCNTDLHKLFYTPSFFAFSLRLDDIFGCIADGTLGIVVSAISSSLSEIPCLFFHSISPLELLPQINIAA